LVQLWIDAAAAGALPSPADLASARRRVGAEGIRFHADGRVELARAGISLDLGGIAKGYALDRMLPLLRSRGVDAALLAFGQSSTLALGAPAGAAGWRMLARGPEEELLGVVTLRDQALSISSSFGQWLVIGGRRYGHVIDPRDGEPLSRPAEALIVSPDATLAEALSKALLILPPDEGLALVSAQSGCEGLLVAAGGGVRATPGWARATRWEPADSRPAAGDPIRGAWPPGT
jgi:thiamine biosynthesis lipoprotein